MRKYIYLIISSFLMIAILGGCDIQVKNTDGELELVELSYDEIKDKLIRFHVIANSDTEEDQALKLKVRDEVVNALSDKLKGVTTIDEARVILNNNIDFVNEIAREVITSNNYDYEVNTMLSHENFPDKVYGDCVVPQGNYEAFRVIIGSGSGQNWWCVMFPTLCFVDETKNSVEENTLEESLEHVDSESSVEDNLESSEDEIISEESVETVNIDKEENNIDELNKENSNNEGKKVVFKWKIGEAISKLFN